MIHDLDDPRTLKESILQGKYDEVVEYATTFAACKDLPDDSESVDEKKRACFRDCLALWALALELKGDWNNAFNAYRTVYALSSTEMKWIEARQKYAWYVTSPKNVAVLRYWWDFEKLCELVLDFSNRVPVDEVVDKLKESKNFDSAYIIPCSRHDEEFYRQAFESYLFRDRCARVVNPRLHYIYGNDTVKLTLLTRRSYDVFIEEMEKVYYEFKRQHELGRLQLQKIESALEVLRRVRELPY